MMFFFGNIPPGNDCSVQKEELKKVFYYYLKLLIHLFKIIYYENHFET